MPCVPLGTRFEHTRVEATSNDPCPAPAAAVDAEEELDVREFEGRGAPGLGVGVGPRAQGVQRGLGVEDGVDEGPLRGLGLGGERPLLQHAEVEADPGLVLRVAVEAPQGDEEPGAGDVLGRRVAAVVADLGRERARVVAWAGQKKGDFTVGVGSARAHSRKQTCTLRDRSGR